MSKRKERTRNAQTWTEAKFWGYLRSVLRRAYLRSGWQPAKNAREKHSRYEGRRKYTQCQWCFQWFAQKNIKDHHVNPCGELRCFEDLTGFASRLFCEDENGFLPVCETCHAEIHALLKGGKAA